MTSKPARAQRQALRRRMNEKRRAIAQRLAASPAAQKRRSRQRMLLAALLLILILCLSRCSCTDPVSGPPHQRGPVVVKVEKVVRPHAKREPARFTKTAPRLRSQYQAENPVEPPWVEAFRLQVAARSQRLAECFVGSSKPGAIRWTASLTAETGAVSNHHIEPVPPAEDLNTEQQRCVVNVLTKPGYQKLVTTYAGALPETVSLVLEF